MRLQGACVWLDGVNNDAISQECQRREAEVLWRIRGGERSVANDNVCLSVSCWDRAALKY